MEDSLLQNNQISTFTNTRLMNSFNRKIVLNIFEKMKYGSMKLIDTDGIEYQFGNDLNETNVSIYVKDERFYKNCILYGDIGFAESYIDGYWTTDSIKQVIEFFILNMKNNPAISGGYKNIFINIFSVFNKLYHKLRLNTISGSKKNIVEHYDLGNDFYSLFLDETMAYSSGIYRTGNESFKESQLNKYENICKLLHLNESHHILEIGSGWGGFSLYAIRKYNCKITTVTISNEQYNYVKELIQRENLEGKLEVILSDYRNIQGKFDRIVSIEMLEAVGHEYHETFFNKCNEVLKEDGAMCFQVITCPDSRYEELRKGVDFIQKHIFPGSLIPSISRLNEVINQTSDMILFQLEDFGLSYAKTLNCWLERFDHNLNKVKQIGFNEGFIRKWRYYLQYCEAAFETRNISVIQMVYTRPNNIRF